MKYLKKIGLNAKKAYEELKNVKHNKIKLVLNNYNLYHHRDFHYLFQ